MSDAQQGLPESLDDAISTSSIVTRLNTFRLVKEFVARSICWLSLHQLCDVVMVVITLTVAGFVDLVPPVSLCAVAGVPKVRCVVIKAPPIRAVDQ